MQDGQEQKKKSRNDSISNIERLVKEVKTRNIRAIAEINTDYRGRGRGKGYKKDSIGEPEGILLTI